MKKQLLFLVIFINLIVNAQERTYVEMQIDDSYKSKQLSPIWVKDSIGIAPGNVQLKIKHMTMNSVVFTIPTYEGEKTVKLKAGSTFTFKIKRKNDLILPYTIKYITEISNEKKTKRLYWISNYRLTGTFKTADCNFKISIRDMDGNGIFEKKDSEIGTNLSIDINNDGKFYGKNEHYTTHQLISLCNVTYTINILSEEYTLIFKKNSRPIPKLGDKVIPFIEKSFDGITINSNNLLGKPLILDFWASWCLPCVEKFPLLKSIETNYKKDLNIITINIDYPNRIEAAKNILINYKIDWPTTIDGLGNENVLWKFYGSAYGHKQMIIPLYCIFDSHGILKYVGNGGKNLNKIKNILNSLFP
ncbi:TlpA disulfide reductase family protein [uncultured Psychroserpens sp.]|uniref:TlpA family protein disulfide reductase n=1 Tax=uncultured Psychroserpens sp. TaxID=255436 RepID=UPI002634E85D|nr:TlpA disulfide reductase family protein [uncultured Psychroserpens sp.]